MKTSAQAGVAPRPEAKVVAGNLVNLAADRPMRLDCGLEIGPFNLAYQTYGSLNRERTNAVLICHALTGDQHVANAHPVTAKEGWWQNLVGPGRILDTDRFFVICANVLGGCMGTAGPMEINPATGEPWGLDFPMVTVGDMVRAQILLLDRLGIESVFLTLGGSMGGMQVLELGAKYPDRVFAAAPIATAAYHTSQNIAFHEAGRQAIMADANWRGGDYWKYNTEPHAGLAVARMIAHITYLSEAALHDKFGRRLQNRDVLSFGFGADFQVESYLRYQGSTFVERFDANSYLYITRAMDYFDLAADFGGHLADAFQNSPTRWCSFSFTSDWLFPTAENRAIVKALAAAGADVSFVEINSDKGHDSFLLEVPEFHDTLRGFIEGSAAKRGLAR